MVNAFKPALRRLSRWISEFKPGLYSEFKVSQHYKNSVSKKKSLKDAQADKEKHLKVFRIHHSGIQIKHWSVKIFKLILFRIYECLPACKPVFTSPAPVWKAGYSSMALESELRRVKRIPRLADQPVYWTGEPCCSKRSSQNKHKAECDRERSLTLTSTCTGTHLYLYTGTYDKRINKREINRTHTFLSFWEGRARFWRCKDGRRSLTSNAN